MRRWFSQTGFVTKEVDGVCACVSMCLCAFVRCISLGAVHCLYDQLSHG